MNATSLLQPRRSAKVERGFSLRVRSLPICCGIVVLLVAGALAVSLLLQRFFPYPFLFLFFAAVMASAWIGGTGCGLFSVLLSTLCVEYFFAYPVDSFAVDADDIAYFAAFIGCSLVAGWLSSLQRQSEDALKEARAQLETRVVERTRELEKSNSQLRASEQQLRLLTEVVPQHIWTGTPEGSIDYCNQRFLDYAGRAEEEMRGNPLVEDIHPDDREHFRAVWRSALSTGQPFEGEWRLRGADGQYRAFFSRTVPLRDDSGKIIRWYGTSTDIDEHKKAEVALRSLQAELAQLRRALSMGELSSAIAHEVDQPLTAVVADGYACQEWLSAQPPCLDEARQAAARIIREGTRAGAVLSRIRALCNKEAPARDWLDMNEIIQELTDFLREQAKQQGVTLRAELLPGLPQIRADRVQLQQVVLNLALNALEAMRAATCGAKQLSISTARRNPAEIVVRVEDTGVGLPAEDCERIFNPFFTTKPRGMGMGLSISRSIIESHKGRIWAERLPAGGARLQFAIPIDS